MSMPDVYNNFKSWITTGSKKYVLKILTYFLVSNFPSLKKKLFTVQILIG